MSKKILFIDCASMGWVSLGLVRKGSAEERSILKSAKPRLHFYPGLQGLPRAFGLAAETWFVRRRRWAGFFYRHKVGLTLFNFLPGPGERRLFFFLLESATFQRTSRELWFARCQSQVEERPTLASSG